MILFKPEMAQAILEGSKTVTRRRGKRRWKVGAEHLCYTRPAFARPPGEPFARVRIVSVTRERHIGDSVRIAFNPSLTVARLHEEAEREGFECWAGFEATYRAINGERSYIEPCWRVEFVLVRDLHRGCIRQCWESNEQGAVLWTDEHHPTCRRGGECRLAGLLVAPGGREVPEFPGTAAMLERGRRRDEEASHV